MTARLATICMLLVFLVGASPAAAPAHDAADPAASLLVEPRGGNFAQDRSRLAVLFDFAPGSAPGRITLYVPRGFGIGIGSIPGAPLGFASVVTVDPFALLSGTAAVVALDADLMRRAASCTDRTPSSAWMLSLTQRKRRLEVPLFVSTPEPGEAGSAEQRVDFCLDALANEAGARAPLAAEVGFSFRFFDSPASSGTYVWRALVAPFGSDRRGARTGAAYELQATVPIPQRLTLSGRYVATQKMVVLTGSLRSRGVLRPRAHIEIIRLERTVTAKDVIFRDAPVAVVRTSKSGAYTAMVRSRRTAGFLAYALPSSRPCRTSQLAPRGCTHNIVAGVESDPVTVSVP